MGRALALGLGLSAWAAAAAAQQACATLSSQARDVYFNHQCAPRSAASVALPADGVSFDVYARCPNNWSGVQLEAGQTYRISIDRVTDWCDSTLPVGDPLRGFDHPPDLWWQPLFFALRPIRPLTFARWFQLLGAIAGAEVQTLCADSDADQSCLYTPHRDGELSVYVNDAWRQIDFFYGNNTGKLALTIRPTGR